MKKDVFLILHNIRSQYNVGSIFRTADAVGVEKIYLTGYTPTPVDRFGRKVGSIAKVSLGAEESVSWEKREVATLLIQELTERQVEIVSVEQDERAIDYKTYTSTSSVAYILGDEVRGVSEDVLSLSDVIIEIPMKGTKESLNVSVATGIILFNNQE